MQEISREVNLEILIDLDIFNETAGSIIENDKASSVIQQRRATLNEHLGSQLFKFDEFMDTESRSQLYSLKAGREDHLEYLVDHLRSEVVAVDGTSFYTMNLIERSDAPNTFGLIIILNEGFLSFMETSSSEKMYNFLQEILRCLYENNVTNFALVNYYMELGYSPTKLFKIAI